jgi:hypothetical protein
MPSNVARVSRAQESRLQENTKLEQVLPLIQRAKDKGVTLRELQATVTVPSTALRRRLTALVKEGPIRGPIKYGAPRREEYYFASGHGPSVESVSDRLVGILQQAAGNLASEKQFQKEVTGIDGVFLKQAIEHAKTEREIRGPYTREKLYLPFGIGPSVESVSEKVVSFAQRAGYRPPSDKNIKDQLTAIEQVFLKDAIKDAVKIRAVLELTCGNKKYYVHRNTAAKHFGEPGEKSGGLTFEQLLPAYRGLKARQRGLSTVYISDLLEVLAVPREALHRLLLEEAKTERVTLHPSTIFEPPEVEAAGIRHPSLGKLYVTVVVKEES